MATPDLLFGLRNSFYLGAYQAAINNSDVPNLPPEEAVERDSLVYRSYIALGSYQVLIPFVFFGIGDLVSRLSFALLDLILVFVLQLVINEIDSSAPTALQAVKLLALYLSGDKVLLLVLISILVYVFSDPCCGFI